MLIYFVCLFVCQVNKMSNIIHIINLCIFAEGHRIGFPVVSHNQSRALGKSVWSECQVPRLIALKTGFISLLSSYNTDQISQTLSVSIKCMNIRNWQIS